MSITIGWATFVIQRYANLLGWLFRTQVTEYHCKMLCPSSPRIGWLVVSLVLPPWTCSSAIYQHASCVLVNEEWRSSGRDGWTAGYPKGSEIFSLTVVSAALLSTVNVSTLLSGHDNTSNVTTSTKWAFYCVSIIFCVCMCVCVCTCVCVQRARHTKHIHMFQAQLKKQIARHDWAFSGSMGALYIRKL